MLNFENTTAWRCLNGEGDRTPGLVVDRYGTEDGVFAVLRLDGALRSVSWVRDTVLEVISAVGFLEKARGQETVHLAGERPPDVIAVREYGMTLLANLWKGQKTGLFLDHREARRRVRALARGRRVLNLYGYTGGFSVAAGLGGAVRVETVDLSKGALELAKRTWEANQSPGHPPFIDTPQSAVSSHPPVVDTAVQSHPPVVDTANSSHPSIVDTNHIAVSSDVQAYLKQDRRSWDFIVADPPSFAPSERAKPKAIEAYTALHTACFHRIAHGGLYLAGSCSSHVTASDFLETLCAAARRAKVNIQILERAGAPADHPRPAAFSEGDYLKTVLARITQ
ncbi:MAG: class I SAM-dependent methyltransferase [Myxococcota bacterium]